MLPATMGTGIALVALVAVIVTAFLLRPRPDTSGTQARALVDEGAVLLDVRTPIEYAAGHLPSALNVPLQQLATRIDEVGERGRAVVVYCASGVRSARAASLLRRAGFARVHDLGSIRAW